MVLLSPSAFSSYLGYPRINFAGRFRADVNTHNNEVCHYRKGIKLPMPELSDDGRDWNAEGTNEFEFVQYLLLTIRGTRLQMGLLIRTLSGITMNHLEKYLMQALEDLKYLAFTG